jgi:two-component system chemotaxis response regulator CheB
MGEGYGRATGMGLGRPTGWRCPECGGGLSAVDQVGTVHFRCHIGHSFSPQTLAAATADLIVEQVLSRESVNRVD